MENNAQNIAFTQNEISSDIIIDSKQAVLEFIELTRTHVNKAKTLSGYFRENSEINVKQMDDLILSIEDTLTKINDGLDNKDITWNKYSNAILIGGGFTAGAMGAMSLAIVSSLPGINMGLMAVLFGITGGVLGKLMTRPSDDLGILILSVVKELKDLQKSMAFISFKKKI